MSDSQSPHILVVDDEELNRGLTALQLSRMGYTVAQSSDGAHALEMVAAQHFDLVLMDIDMPGMNGLDAVSNIRQVHSAVTLPIIMATADDQAASLVDALSRGANDYLVKPINMQIAAARIRTQLAMRELVRMKDEFLAFASHDLKKPLMLEADVLQQLQSMIHERSAAPGEIAELVELLINANRNMQTVVRGFLDANASVNNRSDVRFEPVAVNAIVYEVVTMNGAYAAQKHISLRMDLDPTEPITRSDPFRIRQILENLVGNALKFSAAQTVTTVKTFARNAGLHVEVSDGGPGFTEHDLRQLFHKGAKLSNAPTGNEQSSGVGLALCKELVQQIDGEIGARNNPHGGATLWFRLPIK